MKTGKIKAFVGFGLLILVGIGAGFWFVRQRGAGMVNYPPGNEAQLFEQDPNGAPANVIPGLEGCQNAEFHGQIDKLLLKWNSFIAQLDKTKSVAEQLEKYRKENGLPVSIHENVVDADVNTPDSLISPSNCSPRPMTLFLKHFLNGEVNFRSANSSVLPAADLSELTGHRVTKHWPAEPDALPEFVSGDTLYFKRMLIPECATCIDETCSEHNGPAYYLALTSNGTFHVVEPPANGGEKFEGHDVECPPSKTIAGINPQSTILCREYVDLTSNKKRTLIYDPPCDEDHGGSSEAAPGSENPSPNSESGTGAKSGADAGQAGDRGEGPVSGEAPGGQK